MWFLKILPPEVAHRIAIFALKCFPRFFRKPPTQTPLVLTPLSHLKFRNRVGLAAGFDKNAESFVGLSRLGFGFIEVGTVTPLPQSGNPKPRLFRMKAEEALVNSLGFNNCGVAQFRKNIEREKGKIGVPLFANIGKGKNTLESEALRDYSALLKGLSSSVDGFVINISSPNTEGLTHLQNTVFLESLEKELPPNLSVFIKLSPDLSDTDFSLLCDWVSNSRKITGVVATNTSQQLSKKFGFDRGGLSGRPLFERSLSCVGLARRKLGPSKVLIGVGGISSLKDAELFREAGADLTEIYTAFIYQGPKFVRELQEKLR